MTPEEDKQQQDEQAQHLDPDEAQEDFDDLNSAPKKVQDEWVEWLQKTRDLEGQ